MAKFNKSEFCFDCMECSKNLPIFSVLSEDELDEIKPHRFEVQFRAGETILKQGASASHILTLTSGLAKLYVEGVRNRQLIIRIIRPWELVGQVGLYFDDRYHYSVSALGDVTACFMRIDEFKRLIKDNPRFAEEFIKNYTRIGISEYEKMVSLSQKQMHGRIADGLIDISKNVYKTLTFDMHLSRQDFADFTGMSKDSAIRILKEFHNEKIIDLNGRKLSILDMEKLESISKIG